MKEFIGSITDVEGVFVGHAENKAGGTGCTAVVFPKGASAGADIRGGAPGTREIDALDPVNIISSIHAIYLGGGSAFGLAGADGVMRYLEEQGIGFDTGAGIVPIVPGAVLFDLVVGDGAARPDAAMGYEAAKNARAGERRSGNIGAGLGASAGKYFGMSRAMKTGVGTASLRAQDIVVGALVAVNPFGDIIDPLSGRIVAGAYDRENRVFMDTARLMRENPAPSGQSFAGNTTIGVVATNALLSKAQARRIAMMAHDGFARAINPIHTMYDGDSIFCVSTGTKEADITALGVMAAEAVAQAILRAAEAAEGAYKLPGMRDISPVN